MIFIHIVGHVPTEAGPGFSGRGRWGQGRGAYLLLLSANEVWGKVIFSQVFVTGGVCLMGNGVCIREGGVCFRGGGLGRPPPFRIRKVGSTLPTGILSCYFCQQCRILEGKCRPHKEGVGGAPTYYVI